MNKRVLHIMTAVLICSTVLAEDPLIINGTVPFLDEQIVAESIGIQKVMHAPIAQKNPTMVFDKSWEGIASKVTVFKDSLKYKMYYRGHAGNVICYAESNDGKIWTKPNLYLFSYGGSWLNNIVFNGLLWGNSVYDFIPFRDSKPGVPIEAQYKALAVIETTSPPEGLDAAELAYWNQGWRLAVFAFKSQDGYSWLPMSETPVLIHGAFNSQNTVIWDVQANQYICYFSEYQGGDGNVNRNPAQGYQRFMKAVSADFITWQSPVWVNFGDMPTTHLNAMNVNPLPGSQGVYIGFPHRYVSNRPTASGTAGASGSLLMSSRNGAQWNVFRDAWLRPSVKNSVRLEPLVNNVVNNGLVSTVSDFSGCPDDWSLYVTESADSAGTTNRLRRYTVRQYGFVSAYAPQNGGELITQPFTFTGTRLVLNYATSAAGSVRVEIQDAAGTPIPGYTLADCKNMFRDYVEHDAAWQSTSSLTPLNGTIIRLRFVLKDAHLYAFSFK